MRVLLTGASGFLGRHVLDRLLEQDISTVVIGRRHISEKSRTEFIQADLITHPDLTILIKASSATHLLHLAWCTEHASYRDSLANLHWVEATVRLVEAFCQAGGRHVIVAGTCAEYDWLHGYCREDMTPLNPTTLYGTAKDATRRLIMALSRQLGVPVAWGRIFIPYGRGEAHERLIPSLIQVFCGHRPAFGIHTQAYRDFLHASDVAEAFLSLLHNGASGAYNISSGQPVQLSDIVWELARQLNSDARNILSLPCRRQQEPPLVVGENTKLKALGWRPKVALLAGLAQSIREVVGS